MGLAERRAVKAFEDTHYPALKKQIDEAAGFEVPVEVRWDKLGVEGQTHLYDECFPKVYFKPLIEAFGSIASDDMGKEALKTGLKKVVLTNTDQFSWSKGFTFEGGVLTIDHKPTTNVDDIEERRKATVELIESKL